VTILPLARSAPAPAGPDVSAPQQDGDDPGLVGSAAAAATAAAGAAAVTAAAGAAAVAAAVAAVAPLARVPSRETAPAVAEGELARRLATGDATALTAIAEWLWEPLAAYAYRIVEDRDAAMDIAQEACVRLWERGGHDAPSKLRSYLFRITRNLALDQLRTRRTRHRLLWSHRSAQALGSARPERPDEALDHARLAGQVQRAIQGLPERRREVFTLAYLRGLSYAEVGEVLGISPKTVQNQMSAALAQLRRTLRPLLDERAGGASRLSE
jgi:RNA polymerase sigma-70 factor, ECF subfamily